MCISISKADLATSLVPICLTAFIGTSISSTVVGASIYYMGQDGYFAFGSMGGAESLAFGALISAVDPVATLAVFGALGVETDLNMRVFGESMINDGVSIVLFKVMMRSRMDPNLPRLLCIGRGEAAGGSSNNVVAGFLGIHHEGGHANLGGWRVCEFLRAGFR